MSTDFVPTTEEAESIRRERYRRAAEILRKWSLEDPGYDEQIGRLLEVELRDSGLRCEDPDEPVA